MTALAQRRRDEVTRRAGRRRRALQGFGFVVLIITTTIAVVYPFYWMVMASFTPQGYSLGGQTPLLLPGELSIDAWLSIFRDKPLLRWLGNTTAINVGATLIVVPVSLLASYSLNRFRFSRANALHLLRSAQPTAARFGTDRATLPDVS